MAISRGQMNRQLYAEGGIKSLLDIIASNPDKFGDILNILENVPRGDYMKTGPKMTPRYKLMPRENKLNEMSEEEVMEMLREKQRRPEYQYDEKNPYRGPRDMRMGGGIMSIPRQNYGFGSFVSSIAGGIGDILGGAADVVGDIVEEPTKYLDPIAQVASFIPGPHQPFAAAYTGARGSGIGGSDFGGLQIGGFTPSGGMFGTSSTSGPSFSPFSSFQAGPGQAPSGGGFFDNINISDVARIASQFQDTRQGGGGYGQQDQQQGGIADIIGKVIQGGVSLYGAKKSYEDQKRINEAQQREYENFIRRQEEARKRYQTGEGLRSMDVRNRFREKADVVARPGVMGGGMMRGLRGLSRLGKKTRDDLDEAYEMVTSRSDFDFNDYKMRGTLMAEELAEIRFKKDFDDLDQKTQLDLYSEASDYLNDVAAGAADDARDLMKERFGKADGGIMDLDIRTNPQGVKEIDYRKKGGFVPPIGIKEKADDIPAMLSNNEFVFTADAVRGAGKGSVNEGAKKMYALMKKLEAGGKA